MSVRAEIVVGGIKTRSRRTGVVGVDAAADSSSLSRGH